LAPENAADIREAVAAKINLGKLLSASTETGDEVDVTEALPTNRTCTAA